jgi:hypothetical protein
LSVRNKVSSFRFRFDDSLDFVYGSSPSVLPHYNNGNVNSQAANSAIGLSTFGHHPATLAQTTIGSVGIANVAADTSVLGQSISYSLSRQNAPRQTMMDYSSPEAYYVSSQHIFLTVPALLSNFPSSQPLFYSFQHIFLTVPALRSNFPSSQHLFTFFTSYVSSQLQVPNID